MKWDWDCLCGLKFETDEMDACLEITWDKTGSGKWKYFDIEDNNVIVGLTAHTIVCPDNEEEGMHRLGFIMATQENFDPAANVPQAPTEIGETLAFGEINDEWTRKFPKGNSDLKKMTTPSKLKQIKYKCKSNDGAL